jgi:predicted lipid-binding transport protein (Tim44 family)
MKGTEQGVTMNRSRTLRNSIAAIPAAALYLGVTAATALGRGGSGSHGFSGGGHSSGGGSFHSGGGYYSHGHFFYYGGGGGGGSHIAGAVVAAIVFGGIGLVLAIILGIWLWRRAKSAEQRHRMAGRERKVEAAAAEAADEDAAFASDSVKQGATALFLAIQEAWGNNDRGKLQKLVGPELWAEWSRRLDDFERKGWRNKVQPIGAPKVDYVGMHNAADSSQDRVVVLIQARLRDYVIDSAGREIDRTDASSQFSTMREYWTLGKTPDKQGEKQLDWRLISIEQEKEGAHELKEKLVATPWSDDAAAHDQAMVEQASAEAVPEGTKIAEVADLNFDGDARAAANDLSVTDGRFAPDVLEIAARRAVAAWAQGIDGDRQPLEAIAEAKVVQELLHPGDPSAKTRLVVRGPQIQEIRISALDAKAEPATMTLEVHITGKRYIEDRDTTEVMSGSPDRDTRFTEHWVLAVGDDSEQPWRIVAVGAPAAA